MIRLQFLPRFVQLEEVGRHPWVIMGSKESEPELPIKEVVQTSIIPTRDDVDPDVLGEFHDQGDNVSKKYY
jgi:hypothetical protein